MDYYGFPPELYNLKFSSRGDATLSRRVVELFRQVSIDPLSFCFVFLVLGEGLSNRRPSPCLRHFVTFSSYLWPNRQASALVWLQKTNPAAETDEGSKGPAWTTASSFLSDSCSARSSTACPLCKHRSTDP
jgi:hypothetical protein